MKKALAKASEFIKWLWFRITVPWWEKPLPPLVDEKGAPLPPPTPEKAHEIFRRTLTDRVAGGWSIEIENQYDAVLSKKRKFTWFLKLIIFLLLLLVFAPLALFYLIVVIIRGVTAKPQRLRIWIDEDGRIQQL